MRVLVALLILLFLLTTATRVRQVQKTISSPCPPGGCTYYFPIAGLAKTTALKGIALVGSCDDATMITAAWEYAWSAIAPNCVGLENISMTWGANVSPISSNSPWHMGFNEPDQPDQSNLTPTQAVAPWHQIEVSFPNKKLVAPAPSQNHPNWLPDFYAAYLAQYGHPPRFDALAVHCYFWTAQGCIDLITYYKGLATQWGVSEIWLTEFGFWPSDTRSLKDTGNEMTKLVNWVKQDLSVTRYAAFTARASLTEPWFANGEWNGPQNLLDYASGILTYPGNLYRGY